MAINYSVSPTSSNHLHHSPLILTETEKGETRKAGKDEEEGSDKPGQRLC